MVDVSIPVSSASPAPTIIPGVRNWLFVFDLETIPDWDLVRTLTNSESTDEAELQTALNTYCNGNEPVPEGEKPPFPRQFFHEIVAFSAVLAKVDYVEGKEITHIQKIGTFGEAGDAEDTGMETSTMLGVHPHIHQNFHQQQHAKRHT